MVKKMVLLNKIESKEIFRIEVEKLPKRKWNSFTLKVKSNTFEMG